MGCCGFSESWPGTCHHSSSTSICPSKAGAVAVAWSIWGRQISGHVWWSTHRDDSTEVIRYSPPRQWLDGSFGGSTCSFIRHCRVPSVSFKCYKDAWMHQVTASSLFNHLKAAFNEYCNEQADNLVNVLSVEGWCARQKKQSPQFHFWHVVLSVELTVFLLIRSFREANFALYCQTLSELIRFFFANNNTNYARWFPIHLREMFTLESTHPQLAQEFKAGKFVVHKTNRHFSALALDQAHEQTNATIKADGGAIGLTDDPSALCRWMLAGPEVSRLVYLYEIEAHNNETSEHTVHHEQTPQTPRTFLERVNKSHNLYKTWAIPSRKEFKTCTHLIQKTLLTPTQQHCFSHSWRGAR